MADEKDLKDLAKARAKSRAEERMKKIGSGDFTRGFGGSKELDVAKAKKSSTTKSSINSTGTKSTTKSSTTKTTKTGTTTKSPSTSTTKKSSKTQIGGVVVDKSAIETPLANTQGRERRNKLIIATLCVLIAIIWIVVILMAVIKPGKPDYNFHVYISGDASSIARSCVDEKYMSEWETPDGIAPRTTLNTTVALSFSKQGVYSLRFRVEVFKGKENVTDAVEVDYLYSIYTETVDENGTEWIQIDVPIEKVTNDEYILPLFTALHFWGTDNTEKLNGITSNNIKIDVYVEFINTSIPEY